MRILLIMISALLAWAVTYWVLQIVLSPSHTRRWWLEGLAAGFVIVFVTSQVRT